VFDAIHTADPNPQVLAYQYLQALPQIAAGQSNKIWIVPAELTKALEGIGGALGGLSAMGAAPDAERPRRQVDDKGIAAAAEAAAAEAHAAASSAADAAKEASVAVGGPGDVGTVTAPAGSIEETQQIAAAPHTPAGSPLDNEETRPIRLPDGA
jgi:hypothetical protein